MKWEVVPLDSLKAPEANSIVGGPFGSDLTQKDYVDWGVPVIRGGNLSQESYFRDANFVYVNEEKADRLKQNCAYPGDLIFTQRGTLGQVGLIPHESKFPRYVISQSQMKLKVDSTKVDAKFLYYYFRTPSVIQLIKNLAITSGVPHINLGILKKIPVHLAPYVIQTNISNILSSYDNLIANNRRRIELLEKAARLLFREWFVHLRFPGHEHVKIVNGVPEGWSRVPLDNLCQDIRVSVDPSSVSSDTPYIGLEHIPRRSITLSVWGFSHEVESNKFTFKKGDILFGKIRPYFHKVGFALVDGITSSDAIVVRAVESRLQPYCLSLLSSDEFVSLASKTVREGSKMPRADWGYLQKCGFVRPADRTLEEFNLVLDPMLKQLRVLALQSRKLAQARDLLLPRLMNGESAV